MSVRSSRLKQSGRMCYKCLNEYLMKEGYKNDSICPCVFIKEFETRFAIIVVGYTNAGYKSDLHKTRS